MASTARADELVDHTTQAAVEEGEAAEHFGRFDIFFFLICTLALATVALLYPGFGTAHPDDSLPEGFEHARGAFERSQFVPLAVLLGIGVLFYRSGRRTRAEIVDLTIGPEAPAPAA